MATRLDCDVLIVGGGNVGLSAAAALRALALRVIVIETRPALLPQEGDNPDVGLRVSALGLGSRRFLEQLQAWPAFDQRGPVAYQQMHVESDSGLGRVRFHAHEHGLSALGWIVDNEHLRQTLWQSCESLGVEFKATAVQSVQSSKRYAVTHLADGTELRSALIVAADGARSPIRQQLQIQCHERDYEQSALVAVVETEQANRGLAWQRYLPGGPLALLPVTEGRSSIVWSMPKEDVDAHLALDDAAFCAALTAASQSVFGQVLAVGERAAFPLSMLLAQHYAKERVLLMGDAAHRIHPQAGQGLNIGLQDAAALAEIITEHQSGGQLQLADTEYIGQLLRAYERWRRSDDEIMVRGVDQIGRLMRGTSPRAKLAGLGFSLANKAWPLKDLFLRHAIGLSGTAPKVFRQAGSTVVSS